MAYHSNISCLPFEILKIIFEKVKRNQDCSGTKDIRTCLHVCKKWLYVAKELISSEPSIKVEDNLLELLLEDIPLFGHKVKCITLFTTSRSSSVSDYNKFKKILISCPNLISINFTGKGSNIHGYLETLLDTTKDLKYVQEINTAKLYSLQAELTYLKVVLQYKSTITSLRLLQLEEVMRGSVFEIISCFPKLIYLETTVSFLQANFTMSRLLEAAPQVQVLKVSACFDLLFISKDTFLQIESVKNLSLAKLELNVGGLHIEDFKYIIRQLDQIEDFSLTTDLVRSEFYSVEESKKLLHDLKVYTTKMENVSIKYKYNGQEVSFYRKGKPFIIKELEIEKKDDDYNKAEEIITFLTQCHSPTNTLVDRHRYLYY